MKKVNGKISVIKQKNGRYKVQISDRYGKRFHDGERKGYKTKGEAIRIAKQLIKWRREAKVRRARGKWLSKKYGKKIEVTDLNPKLTREKRRPRKDEEWISGETLIKVNGKKSRTILVDERIPRRYQHRVIKHEMEHLKNPRAQERTIEKITYKKYGFKKIGDIINKKKKRR